MRPALLSARLLARSLAGPHSFSRRLSGVSTRYLKVSEEVRQAIAEKRPVVALETTIYTHGFPYPDNVALATSLEAIVRALGATPATIGILDGVARVGLDREELLRLTAASQDTANLLKISRRDLGLALGGRAADGRRWNGGTTIAGTSLLANLAGIKVFATGGLGGVHRGAENTFDISADLTELGRTPVAVIAAGCKAFLDIAKTLEYLETQGVPVMTLADGRAGQVDFPGFWSRDSGCTSPMTIQTPEEAAAIVHAQTALGLQSGTLIGCPVPAQYEIPFPKIKGAIEQAVSEANKAGMTGHRNTPFILNKIKELTGSQSIRANTALIESNVTAGTRVAIELARLEKEESSPYFQPVEPTREHVESAPLTGPASAAPKAVSKADVYVAGMLAVDFACDYAPREHAKDRQMEMATSNPAHITQSLGGVGHNVALAAHLSGANVKLCSAVGDDMNGRAALAALQAEGMSAEGVITLPDSSRTAQYVAVNDEKKDLVVAMADMSILEGVDTGNALQSTWQTQVSVDKPSHVVIDANWSPKYLASWISIAKQAGSFTIFEPVSTTKATGLFVQTSEHSLSVFPQASIDLSTPNSAELSSIYDTAREQGYFDRPDWWQVIDAFGISSQGARAQLAMATTSELVDQGIPQKTLQLLPYIPCIATKLGAQGVLVTQIIPSGDARLNSSDYAPYILSRCNNGTEVTIGVGGIYIRLFPVPEQVAADDIVSVNGVGDTFAGVLVAGLANRKKEGKAQHLEGLIDVAQRASVLTLKSKEAVSPGLGVLKMLI